MFKWNLHIILSGLFCILCIGFTALCVACHQTYSNANNPYNILLIHSYRADCPWKADLNKGVEDCLKDFRISADIKTFYLDSEYFSSTEEISVLNTLLDGTWRPDLILLCDDPATLALIKTQHPSTYEIPIVFCGVDYYCDSLLEGHTNITGYTTRPDYAKCLELIRSLYPSVKKVIFEIEDNTLGKLALNELKKQCKADIIPDSMRVQISNMDKEKGKQIMWNSVFASNVPHIMPVWSNFYSGRARNTNVPFFAVNSEGFGLGYLGGYMTPAYDQTYQATKTGISILSGESVSDFPVVSSKQIPVFDWEQMKKSGVSMDQLPQGSVVVNISFGEKYHDSIVVVVIVLLLFVGRLAFMLVGLYRTEKKQKRETQNELKEHRKNLKTIMSSIREGVISIDLEMNIFAINPAALRWLHLDGCENGYIGRNIFSLIDIALPGRDRYLKTLLQSVLNKDKCIHFEQSSQMFSFDSQYHFPVVGALSAIYQSRQLYGAVITFHDITEEFTQKEFLTLTMGTGNVSYWHYDASGMRLLADSSFFTYYDIPDDGSHSISLKRFREMIHPDDLEAWINISNKMLRVENKKLRMEMRINFNGKGYQWWECRFANRFLSSFDTRQLSVFGICINIQKFKQTQNALVLARNKARMSDKLKSAFLANMSHEIRTPLNAIVGFSNLLTSGDDYSAEERRLFIETIQNNCDLLLALISDILDLAQIESGTMFFKDENCDVNELINQIVITQQVIIPNRLKLIEKIPSETICIITDKLRLNQVITNLINNAVKFTEKGSVTVGYIKEPGNYLCFFVEDTGCGIPEKDQKNVFERFFKKNDFTQGAGLGLSICRMIVDRMNGTIEVESKEGVGSRFNVKIPYIAAGNKHSGDESSII